MSKATCVVIFLAMCGGWSAAGTPLCCRIFSIDATQMLGVDPAECGHIPDADNSTETVDARNEATRCALQAQSQGRAFVYTYRVLVSPNIDLIVQAVFGAHGERLLLKTGQFAAQDVQTRERCQELTVLADGKLRAIGCHEMAW